MNYGEKQYPRSVETNFDVGNWVPEQDFGHATKEISPIDATPVVEDQSLYEERIAPVPIMAEKVPETTQTQKYDFGSHFDGGVLSEVRQAEKRLSETGAVSDFYEAVRGDSGMTEAAKKWKD